MSAVPSASNAQPAVYDNPRPEPYRATFGRRVRCFATETQARQWLADRLGANPWIEDHVIDFLEPGGVTKQVWPNPED